MNAAMINVTVMTTAVEPANSCRVAHETLVNSTLTSFKKFDIFLNMFILTAIGPTQTGAAGVEPAVTVLETVGLPLTDAPII